MAAILKTVKLQYLRNGLTDRHKIWQSDANCPGELHYPGRYTALTILRNKTAKNIKQNWLQFLLVVKAAGLKHQISKFYNFYNFTFIKSQ